MRRLGFSPWRAQVPAVCALMFSVGTGLVSCGDHSARVSAPLTYYVSPTGHDAAAGTSPATAWRTVARASSAVLRPGTRLLLAGGSRFTGPLTLSAEDAGKASLPVRIGSYGWGRATIAVPSGSGIVIHNTAGINISDLAVVGQGSPANGEGINLYNDLPGNPKLDHVVIDHVDVSGFADGIAIGGGRGSAGFRDVRVSNSAVHDNLDNGLLSYGPPFNAASPGYAHAYISLWHVSAYRNHGDPAVTQSNSGSGIVLGSVSHATVAWSTAYDNGGRGGATFQGPQGIWTYDSTRVVIEHCLSYHNRSHSKKDGGGFDLDQNTSNSLVQYNLSYDNSGPGYLIYTGQANSADTGNVVRFNISSGDTRNNKRYGGIQIAGRIMHAAIYQNTVVMFDRPGPYFAIPLVLGQGLVRTTIRNNIFVTYHPGLTVDSRQPLPRSAVLLQGNDYFSAAGQWEALWGGTSYNSLSAFRSGTGQEELAGRATGFAVGPRLTGPVLGLHVTQAGGGGRAFLLRPGSGLLRAGLDLLRLFGVSPGHVDYSGHRVSVRAPNVGAQ
jgi:parallel beta helix pectate lyase-like protein